MHFQPGEGPCRGLFRDSGNRWIVCSTTCNGIVLVFENNSCSTISALAAYLYKLLQDEELFLKYFEWRKSYNVYRWHFIENQNFSVFIHITGACSFTSVPDPCALCDKVQSEEWKTPKVRSDVLKQVYRKCDDMFMCRCITTCTTGSSWAPAASLPSETQHPL